MQCSLQGKHQSFSLDFSPPRFSLPEVEPMMNEGFLSGVDSALVSPDMSFKDEPLSPADCNSSCFSSKKGASNNGEWMDSSPTSHQNGLGAANLFSPLSASSSDNYSPSSRQGRDEISSPSSIQNWNYEASTDIRKKKGPAPRMSEELCLVCRDRASGYHYNALTCEGCKGFFRRSITKGSQYSCKYGANCEMDMFMRRKCQECRFKKCLDVGMKADLVLPENKCREKREQKRARNKDKFAISLDDAKIVKRALSWTIFDYNKEREAIVNKLVAYQDKYECPTPEQMHKHPSLTTDKRVGDSRISQITGLTSLSVELTVLFVKLVPRFSTLEEDLKLALLKASTSELIMLRAARRYDRKNDAIVFSNNQLYVMEDYDKAGMSPSMTKSLFDFCRNMNTLQVDNAEYALLTVIALFSDRPDFRCSVTVMEIQDSYLDLLMSYVCQKVGIKNFSCRLGKLLNILTELRTLGFMNSEQSCDMDKSNSLPSFLGDLWDINSPRIPQSGT